MKLSDATKIGQELIARVEHACEINPITKEYYCVLGGGIRRGKQDVHDIEIVAKPVLSPAPRPEFGNPASHKWKTGMDKALWQLEQEGLIQHRFGADKMKQYSIYPEKFGVEHLSLLPFCVEFWLVTPPAQWGVILVVRTGPGDPYNNFSKWIVTNQNKGGALPDKYAVKGGAVWNGSEIIIETPTETDFFNLCGLDYIESSQRIAKWRNP